MSCQKNPIVTIAAMICGVSIPIVLIVGIFNKDKMWAAAPVIGVLAAMGVVLAFVLSRKGPQEPPDRPGRLP
ncbi:MAG TPA: hypothetical protein VM098_02675 [Phycisphaerae bacterium]|nr:hypothetical protein [Phycisphaerae bacterium]